MKGMIKTWIVNRQKCWMKAHIPKRPAEMKGCQMVQTGCAEVRAPVK
jgi:hypothetical protein